MRRAFADPEFPKEFHKLMGDDPAPLGGEELEKAIKALLREKRSSSYIKNSPARSSFAAAKRRERNRDRMIF